MRPKFPADDEVEGLLRAAGVESLCQWDVLIFLHQHQTSLVGADYIARLLGYPTEPAVAALDALESLGFVERSRVSQGARLYQFTVPPVPPRGDAFERLLALADHRAGRLRLAGRLRRGPQTPSGGPDAARRIPESAQLVLRAGRRQTPVGGERRAPWRKAI